jgi:predicted ATPase
VGRLHDVLEAISETQNTLQATGERWVEAELNRIAGEVALMLPEADTTRAEIYFDRALEVARKQQASPGNCAPQ